jgi:lipopolysaccharide exporter
MSRGGEDRQASRSGAVGWVLAARHAERALGIVSIAVLARILTPPDFGLVAMASSVVAVVEVVSTFGFDWALVRLQAPTREHYDTAWTLRFVVGCGMGLILAGISYPVGLFYKQPAVTAIMLVMACNSVIGSLENIWMAEFRRQSRFEPEFQQRMAIKVVGFAVAVILAFATHSYWSLVLGVTIGRLAGTLVSYRLHRARPRWCISRRGDLMSFSVWMLVGNLATTMYSRFAEMWLGRVVGAGGVSFYSMASELSTLASTEVAAPINRGVFGHFTTLHGNIPRLREEYLKVAGLTWLVGFPMAAGTGVCAHQIVAVLLGKQWVASAAVMQVLAAAGLLYVVTANSSLIYYVQGRARFIACLSITGAVGFVSLTVLVGRGHGVLAVAWAQVLAVAVVVIINQTSLMRTLGLRVMQFVARAYRIIVATSAMVGSVAFVGRITSTSPTLPVWLQLVLMVAVGIVSYVGVLGLLWLVSGRPEGPEGEAIAWISARASGFMRGTPKGG